MRPVTRFKSRLFLNLALSYLAGALVSLTFLVLARSLLPLSLPLEIIISGLLFFLTTLIVFSNLMSLSLNYLNTITAGIRAIADGHFDTAIPVISSDELGSIAASLNEMARKLEASRKRENDLLEKERLDHLADAISQQQKHDLITSVAHDLRTPLTSMMGYLQLLQEKKDLSEAEKKHYFDIVTNKAQRLKQLLDDLFAYAALNDQNIVIKKERLNMADLLAQLNEEWYPLLASQNQTIHLENHAQNPYVIGDGSLLMRVFSNLLSNAAKYATNGEIDILIEEDPISLSITISNTGKTLSEEELKHLFDRFYRTDAARQSTTGGAGLGLAIARDIIEIHGGEIYAQSQDGKTSFTTVLRKADK